MKTPIVLMLLFVLTISNITAQEKTNLTLQEAVKLATTKSNISKIADTKVNTAKEELTSIKNNRYPDFNISGQYSYLTSPNIDLKLNTGSGDGTTTEAPDVNSFALGQANITLPLFSGFKIKNSISAGENHYNSTIYQAKNTKEVATLNTINAYANLYMAKQNVALIKENLAQVQQRVKDFSQMEKNGLLAKNDLLKATIQQSNIEISLENAKKDVRILNYRLATNLKLPENTVIELNDADFDTRTITNKNIEEESLEERNDIQALQFEEMAAKNQIKVAKANYYPSIGLVSGYTALDLNNALTITNAINIGVSVSYNVSDIFKNKSKVKAAESRAKEVAYTLDMALDNNKVQLASTKEEYLLALHKFTVYTTSVAQAVENYRIVKDKYDNGLVDTNDLLEADVEQLQAKINLAFSKAEITKKYYELLAAKGQLANKFSI
ncbi:TolC family protein [Cellulophaga sp. 20_2_10]|uniref:TolC family protein n=1 Tax=Cellulophaga sp. 20_2_10 TaxID=2942476 RepID=UPI00201B1744|nr:TolC family protein [Cellulophaga sp. 20_2_10]MCL5247054.1 TolC family protein [Cellulophaga sp. 20_2_10]